MEPNRFDAVARLFAGRTLTRRAALAGGAAGLAAGALAAAGVRGAAAQDATPVADGEKVEFLFVQSFRSGSIVPKEGAAGTYALTLAEGLGQTIYFSDRPERIVGTTPTVDFLKGLPFGPDNPPNAALVLEAGPDDVVDVLVLELTAPTYDEATHTASYEATILADYEKLGVTFQEKPTSVAPAHAEFGAASLFIDDCPDADPLNCYVECDKEPVGDLGNRGMCWSWSAFECQPCRGGWDGTVAECNATFPFCTEGHYTTCFTDWGDTCSP